MTDADLSLALAQTVSAAAATREPLAIRGGASKEFLTGHKNGKPIMLAAHRGILQYVPTELVLTARAGTPLEEVEATLAQHNQMLAFEPPAFAPTATLGGTIACNLSGPRRPYAGAARDFVLGMRIINGKGEILSFGGQVMKNVAGYDMSRLLTGSRGTLGVILDISLKVLPKPAQEISLAFELPAAQAIHKMNSWAGQALPLSGAAYSDQTLTIRLSGSASGVQAARTKLGGELLAKHAHYWQELREQSLVFFRDALPLWRLSVPAASPPLELPGRWLLDWGGAQRWLKSDAPAADIHAKAEAVGGYASLFRGKSDQADARLPEAIRQLQNRIKQALDPAGIFT